MTHDADALRVLLSQSPAILVSVAQTQGSVPRERGAWMAVFADRVIGTVGGGHLEYSAITDARQQLPTAVQPWRRSMALGPSLGQCCGGRVQLLFEPVNAGDRDALRQRLVWPRHPVALFGAGHVGHAVVRALAPLPFALHWVDSRDGAFPADVSPHIRTEHSNPLQAAVHDLMPNTRVLVMSFSHAEDLEVIHACLQRQRTQQDLPFVGLIGSRTKWAAFARRLLDRGFTDKELQHVTCPIGLPGITGKAPPVIAASVAAQLLLHLDTI